MKSLLIKTGASVFLLFLMLFWNGCDDFNSLPLNIPFTLNVTVDGSSNTLSDTSDPFCITTDSQTYSEYQDKIQSLHFVEAAYRTISVTPVDLKGDITVALYDGDGNVVFSHVIPSATPADYMKPNTPFILQLNQEQIDFINANLDQLLQTGACFSASFTVENITGQTPYHIDGAIDMVIEADTQF